MDLNWLRSQLERPGYSQAELARRLGLAPSGVSKILIGKRKIIAHEADIIREYVGSPPGTADTVGHDGALPHDDQGQEFRAAPNAEFTNKAPPLPARQEMDKDVPVYGTVVGGDMSNHADFELNGTIVDYVRRPPRLRGRADVFAAYTQGESMLYWREPGQLIYFEKARPPRAMDYVLVELKPHNGDEVRPALIKRLLAVTPTKIRLRQYNPPKDFEIDRSKVYQLVRVIDWDELMAV